MSDQPYDQVEVKLQNTSWMLSLPVTQELLGDVTAKAYVEHELQVEVIRLRGELWYENLETIEYPADWWEAFKARWLPRWARRRWPVRMRRYEVNAYYPGLKPPEHPSWIGIPRLEDREAST